MTLQVSVADTVLPAASGAPLRPRFPQSGFCHDGYSPLSCVGSGDSKYSGSIEFPASLELGRFDDPGPATPVEEVSSMVPSLPDRLPAPPKVLRRPLLPFAASLAVAVPLMAATVAYAPGFVVPGSANTRWQSLGDLIHARARVDLTENFGGDLHAWASRHGSPQGWGHDAAGFVRPAQLAIYIKSVPLSDFQFDFLGLIERKSLGFVYRAMDFDNYYAGRITILRPGPIPEVALERYAVIDGHAGPITRIKLPFAARMDTIYSVQVEAHGDHFITRINEQFIDGYTDGRLLTGGVGFFSGAGESAGIQRMHVTGQDDLVGKLCSIVNPRLFN
jgi:hypothetical protein